MRAGGYACNTDMMLALQPQTLEMMINYALGSTCGGSGIKAMPWAGGWLDPTHASMMFNRCCCLPTETAGYKTNGKWFWFGGEVLRTVIVREQAELVTLGAVILLRGALTFLIHWEIKNEEARIDESAECLKDAIQREE